MLDRAELDVRVDASGTIHVELRRPDSPAQRLVSEMMILYNVEAARSCQARGAPIIYRVQGGIHANDVDESLNSVLRRYLILKSTPPPDLSLEPGAHGMLGVEVYTQATSPLRRCMDLVHQRQLAASLDGGSPPHSRDEIARILYESEERLRELRRLEPDRRRQWLAKHLRARGDSDYAGVVLEPGERISQVEILDFALRAPALTHGNLRAGDTARFKVAHTDTWDGTIRFAQV